MSRGAVPKRVLIVDGYNVLNARRHVTGLQALADARDALIHELQDYAGYSGQRVIIVFDAWQGDRKARSVEEKGNVQIVFTQKGETADNYIERLCDSFASDIEYRRIEVRVATSDGLEQTIVLGRGAVRMSSRELLMEMNMVRSQGARPAVKPLKRTTVGESIPKHIVDKMRDMVREDDH